MPIGDGLWGDTTWGDSGESVVVELNEILLDILPVSAVYRTSNTFLASALTVTLSQEAPVYPGSFAATVLSFTVTPVAPTVYNNADTIFEAPVISFTLSAVAPLMVGTGDTVTLTAITISAGAQAPAITCSCNVTLNVKSLQALAQALALVSNDCGVSVAVQSLTAALQEIDEVDEGTVGDQTLTSDEILAGWWDCDECGFTYQKIKLIERWDGALVCNRCYEERHPLDEVYTY